MQPNWVGLAWGPSRGSSHDMWHCSHLEAWLKPEDPPPGWLIHMTVGRRLSSSPCRHLHWTAWMSSWHGSWFPPERAIQESMVKGTMSFMIYPQRSHPVTPQCTVYTGQYCLHSVTPQCTVYTGQFSLVRMYPKVWIPEDGEHWGPSWRLSSWVPSSESSFLSHKRWPIFTHTSLSQPVTTQ